MIKWFSFFPPIYVRKGSPAKVGDGSNAKNNPFRIYIDEVLGGEAWGAVLAQERWEWGFKWKCLILPAFFLGRHIELMGHAVEIEVAVQHYGRGRVEYTLSEAYSLAGYKAFSGDNLERCVELLAAKREAAAAWVARHPKFIAKALTWKWIK